MTLRDEAGIMETLIDPAFQAKPEEMQLNEKPAQNMVILDDVDQKSATEKPDVAQDAQDDYDYARNIHLNVIKQTEQALGACLEMAQIYPNPRTFEVTGKLLTILSDSADKLMRVQKEYRDISEEKSSGTKQNADTINNNNIVFHGTQEELMEKINADI